MNIGLLAGVVRARAEVVDIIPRTAMGKAPLIRHADPYGAPVREHR